MSKDMLGLIVRQLVLVPGEMLATIYDLLQKLSGSDGEAWLVGLRKLLREEYKFETPDICAEWSEFYRKYFRISVNFSDVVIPDDPGGFDRVIFIPKGLTPMQVVEIMSKKFEVEFYGVYLDSAVTENLREADKPYAVRCRDRAEADEELKHTSANQLKEQNVNSLTLVERLVLELKYLAETGKHLDVENVTLCAGSRYSIGDVPSVGWSPGDRELCVGCYGTAYSRDYLRARQAAS